MKTKDIDYGALHDRTGIGMARGLAAETIIAIYKTARLAGPMSVHARIARRHWGAT
jgi:hypothetical protein